MAFSPLSFVLGLAAAWAVPIVTRAFRPLAIEVTAVGMGLVDDARRLAAEQLEAIEDIAAEARARHEELAEAAHHGSEPDVEPADDDAAEPPPRRRRGDRSRAHPS
jgi:hypothetical protein